MAGRVQAFTPEALSSAQKDLYEAIAGGPRARGPPAIAS